MNTDCMEMPIAIENGVIIGSRGQLFLATGAHCVAEYVSGKKAVAPQSFQKFRENIQQRKILAQQKHSKYLHVIVPDKQSVHEDCWPLEKILCLGEEYLLRCEDISDLVLYLKSSLKNTGANCFLHTDTHLNDLGLVEGVLSILEVVGEVDVNRMNNFRSAFRVIKKSVCGDLGEKLTPTRSADEDIFIPAWRVNCFSNNLTANNGLCDVWISPDAQYRKRLLLFGDSFGRSLCRMLTYFYAEVLFCRTPFLHDEIVKMYRPDFVLTENAERYLSNVVSDAEAPPFLLMPYLREGAPSYSPGQEFVGALSAVLNPLSEKYRWFVDHHR